MIGLKHFREDNNIKQSELCRILGIAQPYISAIESGKRPLNEEKSIESISLDKSSLTIKLGEEYQFTTSFLPIEASTPSYTWISSNEEVATISENGKLVAIGLGTTTITIQIANTTIKTTCSVTILPIEASGITINPSTITLLIGNSENLTCEIEPENTTNKDVIWSSSDESIATVNNGLVKAIAIGEASIFATTKSGNKSGECKVKVEPIKVESITLGENNLTIKLGSNSSLMATILPSNATNTNIIWESSNPQVAQVTKYATDLGCDVAGISIGNSVITAKTEDGNKIATCNITIEPIFLQEIKFDKYTIETYKGQICKFNTTFIPSNATNKNIKWTYANVSTSTNIPVSIDNDGNITILADHGQVLITATSEDGQKTQSAYINIKQPHELIEIDACIYQFNFSTSDSKVLLNSSIYNPTSLQIEVLNVMFTENNYIKEIHQDLGVIGERMKASTIYNEMSFSGLQYLEITSILSNFLIKYQIRINGNVFNIERYVDANRVQKL